MADRIEKVVDIKVNAKGAKNVDKNFKEINKGLKDIEKQAAKAFSPAPAKKLNDEIKKTATATVDVRSKLRDLQNKMAEIGDVGSAEFQQLAAEAGKYKDQMNNANAAIKSMSADFPKMALIGGGLTAMGGAAQGATGAMMLFGAENEEAAKAIQKMMAIQQVMNSVTVLTNSLSDESALGLKVRTILTNLKAKSSVKDAAASGTQTIATVAQTVATGAASVAMAALNFVMNLNPVIALISGIAALAAGMYYFSASTEDATEANDALNKSLDEIIAKRDIIKAKFSKDEEINRRELILTGASKKELHDDDIKRIKNAEKNRKNDVKFIIASNKSLRAGAKLLRLQGKEEEAVANEDKIKANQSTYNTLLLNASDYKIEIKEANKEFNDGEAADQKVIDDKKIADANANHKAYKSRIEAKKVLDKSTARAVEDARLANREDSEAKEQEANMIAFKRFQEDTLANTKLSEQQKQDLIDAASEKGRLKRIEINAKYKAIDDKVIEDAKIADAEKVALDLEVLTVRLDAENEVIKAAKAKQVQDNKEAEEEKQKQVAAGFEATKQGLEAAQAIANLMFDGQLKAAEGNEAKQEIIRRKAFNANKAVSLSLAVIQGVQSVMGAYTSANANVAATASSFGAYPVIMASLAGVFSAVNIAKIASSQYKGGSSGGATLPSGGGGAASIPQFNVVGNSPQNQLAQSLGQNKTPIKAFVVSGDVTSAQSLERNAIRTASL